MSGKIKKSTLFRNVTIEQSLFSKNFDLHFLVHGYNFNTFPILDGSERKSKVSPFEEKYSTFGQTMQ
jgi:hypothetical protein